MSFLGNLRRAWPVLLAYGVFAVWGVGCFVASLALTSGGFGIPAGDLGVLFGILVATAVGHVAGNLLGLTRLRLAVVVVAFTLAFVLAVLSGVALGPFALFALVFVLAALGGYLGIASRLDVVAAWFPLSFAVGGAIVWMNRHGAIATFEGGAKHAVWDPFTILCLSGAVFLMLLFLATRQSLALTVWQEVGRPRPAIADPSASIAIARPGRGSILVLLAFSIVVLGATALVSPYLFRTAPSEKGDPSSQGPRDDRSSKGRPPPERGDDPSDGKGGKKGDGSAKGNDPGGGKSGDRTAGGEKPRDGKSGGQGDGSSRGKSGGRGDGSGNDGSPSQGKGSGKGNAGDGDDGSRSQGKGSGKGDGSGDDGSPSQGKGNGKGNPGDGDDGRGKSREGGSDGDPSARGDKTPGKEGDRAPNDDPLGTPDPSAAGDGAREALGLGLNVMAWFLALAAALFLIGLLVLPPIRRALLLRHLERPMWPVSPTERVMNLWRRALAALALLEITPGPAEVPRDFARRAGSDLAARGCDASSLEQAAAIVEKVDYAGRGIGPGEEQTMRAAVMDLVRTVDARVGAGKKVAAAWGPAPEVEPH